MPIPYNIAHYRGEIEDSFYWNNLSGSNDAPFDYLGYTSESAKYAIASKILGYEVSSGIFPYCRTIADVKKLCDALNDEIMFIKSFTTGSTFTIGPFTGTIVENSPSYFWLGDCHSLERKLGKSLENIQREFLGYVGRGAFPECNSLKELYNFCKRLNELLGSPEFEVGDHVIITKGVDWTSTMDRYIGAVVQITGIDGTLINFRNDGGYYWSTKHGHFRKATSEEIEASKKRMLYTFPDIGSSEKRSGVFSQTSVGLWYWCSHSGDSDIIFRDICLDKTQFQEKILGYSNGGLFPECESLDDAIKLCNALEQERYNYFRQSSASKAERMASPSSVTELVPAVKKPSQEVTAIIIKVPKI